MDKEQHISQDKINEIWRKQWSSKSFRGVSVANIFQQRLFVEGYPIFKKHLPDNPGDVLDAGGGTGRYGLKIAQNFPESNVVISDILEESLGIGQQLASEMHLKNVFFEQDDLLSSKFPDNKFDVVVSDVVIQHLPDYTTALKEIKRITKPGGRILISTNNFWNFHTPFKTVLKIVGQYEYGYEKSFSRKELVRTMAKEGLNIIAVDGFYVGYGIFRLKKYNRIFHFLGRAVNRLSKILDKLTGRFFSRNFGFEILVVAQKP